MESKQQVLITLYALLHSKRYKQNLEQILKYKKFLEEVALPWVTEDKKDLRGDTPLSIKRKYTLFKKHIRENFLDIQTFFEKFSIEKRQLREFDNCFHHKGSSTLGKSLLNLLYNFEKSEFNEEIDSRISELGGIKNYSDKLLLNLDQELFI